MVTINSKMIKRLFKNSPRRKPDIPGLEEFKLMAAKGQQRFVFREEDNYPCLDDNTGVTDFDRHYIYHPAWAARIVKEINPEFHVDISSTLHFSSILSSFIPVRFYDYRPANLSLDNLACAKADLMSLSFASNSINSLSCMHTVEHIGLGRYGDKIDYDGDLKAVTELARVIEKGGNLLFVVPLGAIARIQFNAHRIYTKQSVIEMMEINGMKLKEFTLIPEREEDGGLVPDPSDELINKQAYGCGCFWFIK